MYAFKSVAALLRWNPARRTYEISDADVALDHRAYTVMKELGKLETPGKCPIIVNEHLLEWASQVCPKCNAKPEPEEPSNE